ncbi:MAG: hypothetical protein UV80_C0002G0297 [Candidatus Peregrinibacteria bacterium GW2011_GWF2_43_17]|nr:MAG: hypothetical protein UV80_C0002G0297 [Candidatus Peregrinibacteria bacterium GW2011_GWF2_43_17]KKT20426.1 MAG: hypothetical protein UW03_C0004G0010 [Candidatus Peregrinibacteria bacterium GW2011_GWA2_43_8]HAU39661.1 hypothetical protein [Candidatus Peregrinibacteria bacterium]
MKKHGFTFPEIILVITILCVSLGLIVLYAQTAQLRADLNSQRDNFIGYLRLAQSDTESGKDGVNHGIHLETNSYTIFSGDTYAAENPENFTVELPETVIFQNILLNGNGNDIIFETPKGECNTYGSVELFSEQINKIIQININELGLVTY